jgi:hypothetical protein
MRMRRLLQIATGLGLALTLVAAQGSDVEPGSKSTPLVSSQLIHGMTISTQTAGSEWGTDGFELELDRLAALGINWVAIHPYAGVRGDGTVRFRELDPEDPPVWLARSISAAHARGMSILIKPHLAYWGSPFAWRGEIAFETPEASERFWKGYSDWTLQLASASKEADAFCVGTELERQMDRKAEWLTLIAEVRKRTKARLSYSANWDGIERVPFWDALDAIGVQAYFPLPAAPGPGGIPAAQSLREAWGPHLKMLRELSKSTGKPVFFAELGYDQTLTANVEPWKGISSRQSPSDEARQLQLRCLKVAFEILDEESDWLRGAFLWKWFVGPFRWENFKLDHPDARKLIQAEWGLPAK